jgi:hypothetical protein
MIPAAPEESAVITRLECVIGLVVVALCVLGFVVFRPTFADAHPTQQRAPDRRIEDRRAETSGHQPCWECGGLHVMLPPGMPDFPPKDTARQEFVRQWLEERMAKETAERLTQVQQVIAELPAARDAEREAFAKRWLELRAHECWRMRRRHDQDLPSSASCGWQAKALATQDDRPAEVLMPYRRVRVIRVQGGGDIPETNRSEPAHFVPADRQ